MARRPATPSILRLGSREIPLTVSRHPRARRIALHVDWMAGGVRLVLPRRAALRDGLDFAQNKTDWILGQIDALPRRVRFAPEAVVPLLGVDHVIRHVPDRRRGVWREPGVLFVSGYAEHLPRRVRDYVRAQARHEAATRARAKAGTIGKSVRRICVRDMKTRWGSCGSNGDMSFCWRLVMAPDHVLDYVVAHEVAHLQEMNHGTRFWALTTRLTADVAGARRWLSERGGELLRYG